MDNIFITGANGFLGASLVKHFLGAGHEVVAVIRADGARNNLTNLNCQIIEYDGSISSLQAHLNANTIVVHTASYYVAEHKEEDLPNLVNSNLKFGLNLLEAMRTSWTKNIINIGTAWQDYKGQERRPVNLYAATKQVFEDILQYYCDAEDFCAISLRLNDTYGETDSRMKLLRLLILSALDGASLQMSDGFQKVNLLHIEDVCAAIYQATTMVSRQSGFDYFNLCSKDEFTLRELVDYIESIIMLKINIDWGKREYRRREVMIPMNVKPFELLTTQITLKQGIERIFATLKAQV